ncbi:PEPxxWA-CTERM sorting domain-containing protein [Sphingomonas sp. BK235]|uniref:PEPxxWA-CTERM sorting domain-containing protein n=1 Tax=Sphingomonas sp. BK235 TaxID=2512131 RepID=UPI0014052425|nr:PEPxxWA-CTERM sorting domain-containing protein [Sphingomonas sp. BK235]
MRTAFTIIWAAMALVGTPLVAAAQGFSNHWSFTDQNTGKIVSGTIDNLQEGDKISAAGLTINVISSPFDDLVGAYTLNNTFGFFPATNNIYSAKNGLVTFANFQYANTKNDLLFFSTNPTDDEFSFFPELVNAARTKDAFNQLEGTVFSPAVAAVPESSTWVMMIVGMGAVGWALRRRRKMAVQFSCG